MKMFKKSLSIVLAVMMLIGCMAVVASAADEKLTVSLRVEGVTQCFYYSDVEVKKGETVFDVFLRVDENDDDFSIKYMGEGESAFIYDINGLKGGSYTILGWDGWSYKVDGVAPDFGVGKYKLNGGEEIVMYYGDEWKTGMQFPKINTENLSKGIVSLTSLDQVYDETTSTMIEKENPVSGCILIWGCNGKTIKVVSDENGNCKIPYKYITAGKHSVQIEKYDAGNKLPTVLRFAPDYTLSVSFFTTVSSFFNMLLENILTFIGNIF